MKRSVHVITMEKGDKNIKADVLSKSGIQEDDAINVKADVFFCFLYFMLKMEKQTS